MLVRQLSIACVVMCAVLASVGCSNDASIMAPEAPVSVNPGASAVSIAFILEAKTGLLRYARGCLSSISCRLSVAEKADLARIVSALTARPDWPRLAFNDGAGNGSLSKWSGGEPTQIVFNTAALTAPEPQGGIEPLSIFRAVRELVVRVGETLPATSDARLETLGGKLEEWLHERAEVLRLGLQRRVVAIDLGDHDRFTEIFLADSSTVIRLEPRMAAFLTCPDGQRPTGARVWSLSWAHGIPGPIFKQPLRGRLNLYCPGGDKLGDDVLIELSFVGDRLVSPDFIVSILECSKGGCYPKRDLSGAP